MSSYGQALLPWMGCFPWWPAQWSIGNALSVYVAVIRSHTLCGTRLSEQASQNWVNTEWDRSMSITLFHSTDHTPGFFWGGGSLLSKLQAPRWQWLHLTCSSLHLEAPIQEIFFEWMGRRMNGGIRALLCLPASDGGVGLPWASSAVLEKALILHMDTITHPTSRTPYTVNSYTETKPKTQPTGAIWKDTPTGFLWATAVLPYC